MKKFLLITSIILSTTIYAEGQARTTAANGPIVQFYPNPATTSITFELQKTAEKGFSIQVFSFLGKRMYEASNVGQRTPINLSDFTRGVYIYQVYDKTGKLVESGKFQVSK